MFLYHIMYYKQFLFTVPFQYCQLEARDSALPNLATRHLDLEDDIHCRLCLEDLNGVADHIHAVLSTGCSVLGQLISVLHNGNKDILQKEWVYSFFSVHCAQGKSRSAAVVVFYLCRHHSVSVEEALNLVRKAYHQHCIFNQFYYFFYTPVDQWPVVAIISIKCNAS